MAKKDIPRIRHCIKDVCSTCNIYNRFRKTPPRPRAALAKANMMNEVVSVDLKEVRKYGKEILYIVDNFSGYMQGEVIPDEKPDTVIKAFNQRWVREGPGLPSRGIFSDNGG